MVYDTSTLSQAYVKGFDNICHVEHWYKANVFSTGLRLVGQKAKVVKPKRPLWYRRVVQLEMRKYERLDMEEKFDTCLITRNGKFLNGIYSNKIRDIELIARKQPNNDWRIEIIEFYDWYIYQRQGRNKWLLIEIG